MNFPFFPLAVVAVALLVVLYFFPISPWITALFSGVRVSLLQLAFMRVRKVPPSLIVNSLITSTKAGLRLTADDLETHFLAGGNVPSVIKALISADKANIPLDFKQATAIDLAGRNVFAAVTTSVNPKVINTPNVAAVAQDGIQLIVIARVTVRANISQLVGGAGEETILARVGEGIVTSIGSSVSHKEVLENPDKIPKLVLHKGCTRARRSRFSALILPTSTSARTSAPSSRPTRPAPTCAWPRPAPRSAARWPWRWSRNTAPKPRKPKPK